VRNPNLATIKSVRTQLDFTDEIRCAPICVLTSARSLSGGSSALLSNMMNPFLCSLSKMFYFLHAQLF
jgi:hypothetical protein